MDNNVQNTNQSKLAQQSETEIKTKKNNTLKFIIIFAGISFLVAFLVGGFVLGTYGTKNNASKITPTPVAKISPTPDTTANWKTYINKDWNFSFKYPYRDEINLSSDGTVDVDLKNEVGKCLGGTNIDTFMIGADRFSSVQEFKNTRFSPNYPFKEINFKGEKATRLYYPGIDQTGGPQVILFVMHNGKGYEIIYRFCAKPGTILNESEITNINPDILSTFKFTDRSPSPTCIPRPACLDATHRCLIPETADMCPKATPIQTSVVCTMDAKQCPDGSYVSRDSSNNCEFKECPK
ncbi:MAG: hypothetical protein M1268_01125 [Patescibacteria group bacterium]|nr:hypothetical protein [Patescibacteria group bacterium]